ncbi:MAG: GGDEF domain-containing response regulator [Actinomycetota bacterium]
MGEPVLVVDDDPDIARFIEVNLSTHGFDVHTASDGVEALQMALDLRPALALVDVMMPRMDGFQLVQRLRADPRTAGLPIIMLTAKALTADKILGLTAGADDYIIKPFDPLELVARVKGTLHRAQVMRAASPLTGLPGNVQIQDQLQRLVSSGEPFALLYGDLDNFKAYNDHYGFLRGDEALRFAAGCIQNAALRIAEGRAFVGHLGGDDFVVTCPPEVAEELCRAIVAGFDEQVRHLYDPRDAERGFIEVTNRQQEPQRFPLLSLSIGVATSERRPFSHPGEAVTVATEMKEYAKREPGSSYRIDRRSV